jgi:hypothetical protein
LGVFNQLRAVARDMAQEALTIGATKMTEMGDLLSKALSDEGGTVAMTPDAGYLMVKWFLPSTTDDKWEFSLNVYWDWDTDKRVNMLTADVGVRTHGQASTTIDTLSQVPAQEYYLKPSDQWVTDWVQRAKLAGQGYISKNPN